MRNVGIPYTPVLKSEIIVPSEIDEIHSTGDRDKLLFHNNDCYFDEFEDVLFNEFGDF